MKKKWYRGNGIKGVLLLISVLSVMAAAFSGVFLIQLYNQGIYFLEDGADSYTESERFADELHESAYVILNGIAAQAKEESFTGENKVIDLEEMKDRENLTYQNTSGLAYSYEDLQEWANNWECLSRYYGDELVIVCLTKEETYEYYKYTDFLALVEKENLQCVPDYDNDTSQETLTEWFLQDLADGYDTDFDNMGIKGLEDKRGNLVYRKVWVFDGDLIQERYAPVGAESLLEVVNTNPNWNGRLEEANELLAATLNMVAYLNEQKERMEDYSEGNSNIAYLYVDKTAGKVYTNRSAYNNFKTYEEAVKEMTDENRAYMAIYPTLVDCLGNLNFGTHSIQEWQHLVAQEMDAEDYIFVLSVDSSFPVQDVLALNAADYNRYAPWILPLLAIFIFTALLFLGSLVWLTTVSGRRIEDEEIHLYAFDRWLTEPCAVMVFAVWILGIRIWSEFLDTDFSELRVVISAGVFYTAVLFLAGYLSLVRRIKAGIVWKNSLLRLVLCGLKKVFHRLKEFLELFSRNKKSKVKISLLISGFCLFQAAMFILGIGSGWILPWFLVFLADLAVVYFCAEWADGQDRIVEGLKHIADGELRYKINQDRLKGEQKQMAEYINRIGEGLDAAVENSLKNERMKTELITNVSHDIKTPLTSIINYVDLLKRENFTDPKICSYLDVLESKAQRLKNLTEDVVEASKASTGNISLEMTELNFLEMVHQVVGEFEERFEEKQLLMRMNLVEQPVIICADGRRLWRVLENIYNNVIKYALEGTRVYTEVKIVEKRMEFSLKNISAQPLNISAEELTERFIRGDVSRNTEGSGLGLSIARDLTELQGGTFALYLDGDLFKVTITFPLITS